nr:ABC transporter permease [Angustibacter aerolatus]
MLSYVVRRVVAMLLMLVALSMVVFGLFQVLPADPAALTCGKSCTPVVIAANRRRLGYDRPVTEQYARFVSAIFVGRDYGVGRARFHCDAPCLGHSFARGVDVRPLLVERMGVTAQEAVGGFVLWIAVGVGGGVLAALWHRRWPDRTLMSLSLLGYSFPDFFIGLLLLYFVVFRFHVMSLPGVHALPRGPRGLVALDAAAVGDAGGQQRGVLHAADPHAGARHDGRGLRADGAQQGARAGRGDRSARAAGRPDAGGHRRGHRPGRAARRRRDRRAGVRPARARAPGAGLGRHLRPAAHRRHRAARCGVRDRREPRGRPALRGARPARPPDLSPCGSCC